jgi:hypothetical protein
MGGAERSEACSLKALRLTEEQLQEIQRRTARHATVRTHSMDGVDIDRIHKLAKYKNRKTTIDGRVFDSQREATRYQELKLMESAGEIEELDLQVRFALRVNRQEICCYIADFTYRNKIGRKLVVEDVKGMKTRDYIIKKKLMKAIHDIEIKET